MLTEILGSVTSGLFGGSGAAPAGPAISSVGPIVFGSKTLGTGAKGGDTSATGGEGSTLSASSFPAGSGAAGNNAIIWGAGILAAAAVIIALIFGLRPSKK